MEDDDIWDDRGKDIFVLSSAGKPIFSLRGDEHQHASHMALAQGLISFCDSTNDDLQVILAGDSSIVFSRRGELTLVAVATVGDTEAFLRLQMDYVYAQLLVLLTTSMQRLLRTAPGYDLAARLQPGFASSAKELLALASPGLGGGRLLCGGVHTLWMDPKLRPGIGAALHRVQQSVPAVAHVLLLYDDHVVALAQTPKPAHRLHSQDLLLLMNLVAAQRRYAASTGAEGWQHVCLPRLDPSKVFGAFVGLIREVPPAEDKDAKKPAAVATASSGMLSKESGDSCAGSSSSSNSGTGASGDAAPAAATAGAGARLPPPLPPCLVVTTWDDSLKQFHRLQEATRAAESELRTVLGDKWKEFLGIEPLRKHRNEVLANFRQQHKAVHFLYRLAGGPQNGSNAPEVTQCLSPPLVAPYQRGAARQRLWRHYQRAFLRLRTGSCLDSQASGAAPPRSTAPSNGGSSSSSSSGSGQPGGGGGEEEGACGTATALFERRPQRSRVYEASDKELVVSLAREEPCDELHVCFEGGTEPEDGFAAAERMLRTISTSSGWMFLAEPAKPPKKPGLFGLWGGGSGGEGKGAATLLPSPAATPPKTA